MEDLLYCYPHSNVLKNKLGIIDQEKMQEVERKLTAIRISDLIRRPIKGAFDMDHLCRIHFYIFQDLYTWAGEPRKTDISKGNLFCRAEHLRSQADIIFGSIQRDQYLKGMDRSTLVKRLSYHFSEINALHPLALPYRSGKKIRPRNKTNGGNEHEKDTDGAAFPDDDLLLLHRIRSERGRGGRSGDLYLHVPLHD